MNTITNLSPQQLRQAADLQEQILGLQGELEQLLGTSSDVAVKIGRSGRRFTAQGLANIRAAVRRRWARERAQNGGAKPIKRRNKMSAAGRARISAMLKARWAAAKRSGRNAL